MAGAICVPSRDTFIPGDSKLEKKGDDYFYQRDIKIENRWEETANTAIRLIYKFSGAGLTEEIALRTQKWKDACTAHGASYVYVRYDFLDPPTLQMAIGYIAEANVSKVKRDAYAEVTLVSKEIIDLTKIAKAEEKKA